MSYPRGLRQNNPGNIRCGNAHSPPWQGQIGCDGDMCVFATMANGIRALARLLMTYQSLHHLGNVRAIISRWAPPTENDTAAYIADVSKRAGISPDAWIDTRDRTTLTQLVRAIAWHENGALPSDEDINAGIDLALARQ